MKMGVEEEWKRWNSNSWEKKEKGAVIHVDFQKSNNSDENSVGLSRIHRIRNPKMKLGSTWVCLYFVVDSNLGIRFE